MKELEISNWDSSPQIVKWNYIKGLIIVDALVHQFTSGRGSQYVYRFVDKDGKGQVAIVINRKPSSDKYAIRGKHYITGKYSKVHRLGKEQIKYASYVRYVFNEIINELC